MTPPTWVTNEQSWRKDCRRVVARAGDLLAGRLGVIAAAQQLAKLRFWLRADDDPDFSVFTAINSESDHLPTGAERQHWATDALKDKDVEIRAIEEFYREDALEAARKLQAKYAVKA
jgi:hypothetical protein